MPKLSKAIATMMGAAMLATTPMSAGAASIRPVPIATQGDSVVLQAQRRRRPRRRYRRRRPGVGAAILGGVILGGIIAEANRRDRRRTRRRDRLHLEWCYDRYRSYRAYDNTFQPYRGGRRRCVSPYY
ncbi:MAG: BA14K family protein [Pseudomonadota bacterium]